jgi:lipooligosaccharide transport system ATP-binding protein
MVVIKTRNLTKKFKDLVAVDGLDLDIEEGEIFALLGPNGAGKTTLVRMITAVSPPTSGDICVLDKDLSKFPRQIKAQFGVIPQIDNLDPELTVLHNLTTFARYFGIPRDEARRRSLEVLHLFKLEAKTNSKIKELSGGMRRRLLLARSLINSPRIIILDEPTIGLDPQSKYLVWQKLKEFREQGVTQLLSTQNMDEATALSDRVAVMHQGRILALGAPGELVECHVGRKLLEIEVRNGEREAIVSEMVSRRLDYEDAAGIIQVFHSDAEKLAQELGGFSWNLWTRLATLEDVFFRLTGRALVE